MVFESAIGSIPASGYLCGNGNSTYSNAARVAPSSYSPILSTTGTAPTTLTFSTQFGRYQQIDGVIFFSANVVVSGFVLGLGTGNLTLSLPVTAGSFSPAGILTVQCQNTTLGVTTQSLNGNIASGANVMTFSQTITIAGITPIPLSNLSATSIITVTGMYFIT
jgi:hypothetical protein